MPDKTHDYSTPGAETVELIVRPNNRYGAALAGERVRIDASELRLPATLECLYSEAEYRDEMAAIERAREEATRPAANPVGDLIRNQLARVWEEGRKGKVAAKSDAAHAAPQE